MKVSLNLLRQLADLNQPAEQIITTIETKIGEVEQVTRLGDKYAKIVVGRIKSSQPHPDADKLSVNKVDVGSGRIVQVVAGDKTLSPGDSVAYIPPGNVVPVTAGKDELKLTVRNIRGIDSHGMLASLYELDFSSSHSGVMKMDSHPKPGTAIADVYQLDDSIIEIESKALTHRPDMFGHLGFARELSACLGQPFSSPEWYRKPPAPWPATNQALKIELDNQLDNLVPRFSLAPYDSVLAGDSPQQIQSWLMRLGIRPINSLVDLTNYIMILSGQPLHAYDFDKVAEGTKRAKFIVRRPKSGERIKLIDGSTIRPHKDAIIIANHKRAIGLGGVMGGEGTEVDARTKRVVLEAANFDMYAIRNTSMKHGIFSEAVTRFARGQDPDSIGPAQSLARQLINQWAGALPAGNFVDDYPRRRSIRAISLKSDYVNQLLGTEIEAKKMARLLNAAEVSTKIVSSRLSVTPPSWRPDLKAPADIAEEIGRLDGYTNIQPTLPERTIMPATTPKSLQTERRARIALSAAGANEVLSYSGIPASLIDAAGQDATQAYRVRNALSPDVELMRLSLTPSLLEKVYPNIRQGHGGFALFEIGPVHNKNLTENKLPQEQKCLAVVLVQTKKTVNWGGAAFFAAREYLVHTLSSLGLDFELSTTLARGDYWLEQASAPYESGRRIFINSGKATLGVLGEFTANVSAQLKLPELSAGFELNLDRVLGGKQLPAAFKPLSKYPPVVVDLTLKSKSDLPYSKLVSAIESCRTAAVSFNLIPLEAYAPDKSHRHTSFRLEFLSQQRTLKQSEVNSWLSKIVATVHKKTGASQV